MPGVFQSALDFLIAFELINLLIMGFGLCTVLIVLGMPVNGADCTDSYGGLNYALVIVMIGVFAVIAWPKIWLAAGGQINSFCFCLILGGIAGIRWHLLGLKQFHLVTSKSHELTKGGASGSSKSGK